MQYHLQQVFKLLLYNGCCCEIKLTVKLTVKLLLKLSGDSNTQTLQNRNNLQSTV